MVASKERKKTKEIKMGSKKIGGNNPILVQSMTKSKISDTISIKNEIKNLIASGCEVIRIAVNDLKEISILKLLISENIFSDIPVVSDVQFDHVLAIESLLAGADCVRINPGNIGGIEKTKKIIETAKNTGSAIRIGVNSGSIDKKVLKLNNGSIANSIIESAMQYAEYFEKAGFENFKISPKASSVEDSIFIYKSISEKNSNPLHLGITEAGSDFMGLAKSAVGIGVLLYEGIGDTIRVSLTDVSTKEVKAGYYILNSLGLRNYGVDVVSCPTCGRTQIDIKPVLKEVEKIVYDLKVPLKVAVMGCIVNGPGEAREADIGIAFGKKSAAVFSKGRIVKRAEPSEIIDVFLSELKKII